MLVNQNINSRHEMSAFMERHGRNSSDTEKQNGVDDEIIFVHGVFLSIFKILLIVVPI